MTGGPVRRLLRIVGWLLTPLVVWAASFLGGWLGAVVGARTGTLYGGIGWMVVFGLVGGGAGLVAWMWVRKRTKPRSWLGRLLQPDIPSNDREHDDEHA